MYTSVSTQSKENLIAINYSVVPELDVSFSLSISCHNVKHGVYYVRVAKTVDELIDRFTRSFHSGYSTGCRFVSALMRQSVQCTFTPTTTTRKLVVERFFRINLFIRRNL